MKLVLALALMGITQVSEARFNIAEVILQKDAGTSRTVILRTRKVPGKFRNTTAAVWAECRLRADRTHILKSLKSISLNHYSVYEFMGVKVDMPADILSAEADQRGVMNLASLIWYSGTLAKLSNAQYEKQLRNAASALSNLDDLPKKKVIYNLNTGDRAADTARASKVLEYLGGIPGVTAIMRACGTPNGLREDLIERNVI